MIATRAPFTSPRDCSHAPIAAYLEPPLTTIRTNPVEQGRLATRMLIGLIKEKTPAQPAESIGTIFVERGSCSFARIS